MCPACGFDCGAPNVRKANEPVERAALKGRLRKALEAAKAEGRVKDLVKFRRAVARSKVVIARPPTLIEDLCFSDNNLYTSHQRQVNAETKIPLDNKWDPIRPQFESALFPGFHEKIAFGCLSLSDRGQSAYGTHFMVFKELMIDRRTSVFEENPVKFIPRHDIRLDGSITPGFRADWKRRGTLAVAKLHHKVAKDTDVKDYPAILMEDGAGTDDGDFIEAHIYGMINRRALDFVAGPKPKNRTDQLLWKRLVKKLKSFGAGAKEF
jgi:hypothetical protein